MTDGKQPVLTGVIQSGEKELKQIRKRQSYAMWKRWFQFIGDGASTTDIMNAIYNEIDSRRGFRSEYNSYCSHESLEQVVKDLQKQEEVQCSC